MPTRNQRPESTDGEKSEMEVETDVEGEELTIERIIADMIRSETEDLKAELSELERQIEKVDDFARVSLNERKIKQNEGNLAEFSDSLTGFAEKAFNNINTLEDRLDVQALLLASMLDALDEEGVDIDLTLVEQYRQESVVTDTSPEEKLEDSLERV